MSTRRAKLKVKPNIGPKSSSSAPSNVTSKQPESPSKIDIASSKEKNVQEEIAVNQPVYNSSSTDNQLPPAPEEDILSASIGSPGIRSRRIKARPNLSEARTRRLSGHFSGSESESELSKSIRSPPPPNASSLTQHEPTENKENQEAAGQTLGIGAPGTPAVVEKEDQQRLLRHHSSRKLDKIQYQEMKEKRRKRKMRELPQDRSKMTIGDFIHYNPATNPINPPPEQRPKTTANGDESLTDEDAAAVPAPEAPTAPAPVITSTSANALAAPQLRVNEDGSIVLDESSLLVTTTPSKSFTETVHEDATFSASYSSFLKRCPPKNRFWSKKETAKFYQALSTVGTDFTTMAKLFPGRNRNDLKRKFKREEKFNRPLVEKALKERTHYDLSIFFREEGSESEHEDEEKKKPTKRKKKDAKTAATVGGAAAAGGEGEIRMS